MLMRSAEVERASENLAKSGKPFGPGFPPTPVGNSRRESMPMMGGGGANTNGGGPGPRPYPDYGMLNRLQHPSEHVD